MWIHDLHVHVDHAIGVALPKIVAVWKKVSKVRPHISVAMMGQTENSTDLAMGRRPKLKSVELLVCLILVVEIFTIFCLKPLKKCYTVWEHDPAPASNYMKAGGSVGCQPGSRASTLQQVCNLTFLRIFFRLLGGCQKRIDRRPRARRPPTPHPPSPVGQGWFLRPQSHAK